MGLILNSLKCPEGSVYYLKDSERLLPDEGALQPVTTLTHLLGAHMKIYRVRNGVAEPHAAEAMRPGLVATMIIVDLRQRCQVNVDARQ